MKKLINTTLLIAALAVAGCKTITGDPVVVRAEQSIAIGNATLNAAVHVDDSNRAFFRTNAPAFHSFCEWLRTPVIVPPLRVAEPRGIAIIESANVVKQAYKHTRGTNELNQLVQALATIETATAQAQGWLTSTKGH